MALRSKLQSDLLQIVAAGGGLRINIGSKLTSDVIQLAAAAKQSGATLELYGMASKLTSDLVKIASAGGNRVIFVDDGIA